jgi:hypothetical protein
LSGEKEKAVTFFEKKVTKKTFGPAGVWAWIAFNRLRHAEGVPSARRRRLKALSVQTPAGPKVFCALFFKKALLSS